MNIVWWKKPTEWRNLNYGLFNINVYNKSPLIYTVDLIFTLLRAYVPYIIYKNLKSCCCFNLITNSGQAGRPCRPNWIINNKNWWELERDTIGMAAWWRCRWKVWWIPQYYQHCRTTTISRPAALCQHRVLYIDILYVHTEDQADQ